MPLLQLDSVSFSYGGHELFTDVNLTIEPGERLGVVGPNGVGKTTLLRLATGELEPEQGRVSRARSVRVGVLKQDQHARIGGTVFETLLRPFSGLLEARRELGLLERAMSRSEEVDPDKYGQLRVLYEAAGGDVVERRVEKLAADLELGASDLHRRVETLSGGERRRLALAQVLAEEPDLLLLDEPTNHLDLDTMERLEGIIGRFEGSVLVISHDRAFLDSVCPITIELSPFGTTRYAGPYRWYVEERKVRLRTAFKSYEKEKAEREKQEELIRRTAASGGFYSRAAKARQRRLDRLDPLEAPRDVWSSLGSTTVRPPPAPKCSRLVLQARGVGARRGGRRLFGDLDLQLLRGERLAIVGPNGSGKSTLLRTLTGDAEEGEVIVGNGVVVGVCDQELEEIHGENTPIAEIRSVRGDLSTEALRSHLGLLRIRGEDQERKNMTLSGGERARVALAKLLALPRNLLALDEPTNNLDIPAREVLEEALVQFEGALIVVSHDRYFLERVATRYLNIDAGEALPFFGTYRELRQHLHRRDHENNRVEGRPPDADKERRKAAHQARKERRRLVERLERQQQTLEEQTAATEVEIEELDSEQGRCADDWQQLQEVQRRLADAHSRLDSLIETWEAVSEQLEEAREKEEGDG